ncbi:MMPL family transporter [Micromonospora sp. NBC_01813]|uniref:MMPL family transporter n=1 Tax=Micromonospora sp. NBC_01813 TaxID=2975988 RepID=UPI002DD79E22|nr:MMPL family transporter [Micromonospora sp. NBC_01813]WSA07792.1 MMPL family transporter [Micromonospora sp. NBC_01813]
MNTVETGAVHRMMGAIGAAVVRRPWWVISAWVLLTITVAALIVGFGRPTEEDVALPGSDGQLGRDLADAHFPGSDDATGQLIFEAGVGRLDDPTNAAAIAAALTEVTDVAHVVSVTPPSVEAGTISADGRIGYATVRLDVGPRSVTPQMSDDIVAAAAPARDADIQTVPGGPLARQGTNTHTSELLGLGVAVIVLVLVFGGLVAAGLPLVTGVLTLVVGVGGIGLAGHLTDLPGVATTLATMIGLGVGIDYALFLVTRYRALLDGGMAVEPAIVATVASSGSAVLFAGGTVMVALAGLAVAQVPILTTLGWTAALVVLVAVAAATTLLPASLTVLGQRINALRVPGLRRGRDNGDSGAFWGRLAARVTRRPAWYAIGSALLLLLLAAPTTALQLGQLDAGDDPPGSSSRVGHDLMAEGFGPGVNAMLSVVVGWDSPVTGADDPRLLTLRQQVAATAGVAAAGPPVVSADGQVATVRVQPTTAASDPATVGTIDALRDIAPDGGQLHVTGAPAIKSDLGERVGDRMPWVIGVVVVVSALLLLFAFRAPVLAVKAAVMNLLSVGAAYGALVAVFVWGWGVELTGLDGPIAVESYVPMMLFALLFGLSMDYEVFLLTAVGESWQRTGDNLLSVRTGLAATGRVITSAALIMVCVFASFVVNPNPVVKMFGLGMAVAITVDATIIRGLLVPATMALLGRANWWRPGTQRDDPPPSSEEILPLSAPSREAFAVGSDPQ